MIDLLRFVSGLAADLVRRRVELVAENALLRQQLIVAKRKLGGRVRWHLRRIVTEYVRFYNEARPHKVSGTSSRFHGLSQQRDSSTQSPYSVGSITTTGVSLDESCARCSSCGRDL